MSHRIRALNEGSIFQAGTLSGNPLATAAGLAKGMPLRDAVSQAKKYVTEAIRRAYPMGRGHGPLNHFYEFWG